jgi:hypothetical protein
MKTKLLITAIGLMVICFTKGCIASPDKSTKNSIVLYVNQGNVTTGFALNYTSINELATPGKFHVVILYDDEKVYKEKLEKQIKNSKLESTEFIPVNVIKDNDLKLQESANFTLSEEPVNLPALFHYGPSGNLIKTYGYFDAVMDSVSLQINNILDLINTNLGKDGINFFSKYYALPDVVYNEKEKYYEVCTFQKIFKVSDLPVNKNKYAIVEFGFTGCVNCIKLRNKILAANMDSAQVDLYSVNLLGKGGWDSVKHSATYMMWQTEGQLWWPYVYVVHPDGMTYIINSDTPDNMCKAIMNNIMTPLIKTPVASETDKPMAINETKKPVKNKNLSLKVTLDVPAFDFAKKEITATYVIP